MLGNQDKMVGNRIKNKKLDKKFVWEFKVN